MSLTKPFEINTTSRKFIIEEIIIDDARKIKESIVQKMVLEGGNVLSEGTSVYWPKLLYYVRTCKKLQMNSNDSGVIRYFNSCLIMERACCLYLGHELITFHDSSPFSLVGVMESLKLKTWRFSGFVPLTWEFRLEGRNLVPENQGSHEYTFVEVQPSKTRVSE